MRRRLRRIQKPASEHQRTNILISAEAVAQTQGHCPFCADWPTATGGPRSNRSREPLEVAQAASCEAGFRTEAAGFAPFYNGLGLCDSLRG
jgi:hypothetical protein